LFSNFPLNIPCSDKEISTSRPCHDSTTVTYCNHDLLQTLTPLFGVHEHRNIFKKMQLAES
jgi:hypothetical protein